MPQMDLIFENLKIDLTAPRILLDQVVQYIQDHYGYAGLEIEQFFHDKFPQLEDYEVDLTFSPQFTPGEHDRLRYIPLLGENALLPEQVAVLKRRLNEAALYTVVKTPDESVVMPLALHEVLIDRMVNLLHLEQALPSGIYDHIVACVPEASHNEANLLARSEIWRKNHQHETLAAFLRAFKARKSFSVPKLNFLTGFIRTYRPAGLLDIERQLDALIDSCKRDMENASARGFHDEYLKALYVQHGEAASTRGESAIWEHYRRMSEMAQELKADIAILPEAAPDILARAQQHQSQPA